MKGLRFSLNAFCDTKENHIHTITINRSHLQFIDVYQVTAFEKICTQSNFSLQTSFQSEYSFFKYLVFLS